MSKIAVLIPTYRPKKYIEKCLISLSNQTFKNFTFYICLNGSDDTYHKYLNDLLSSCELKYRLFNLDTAGVSNARNFLLDNSTEEFICFVDDDDYLSNDYLEALLSITDTSIMGISNCLSTNNDGLYSPNFIGKSFEKLNSIEKKLFHLRKYFSTPCAKLLHRAMIGNFRFNTKLAMGEDALFMAEISKNISVVKKTESSACYYVFERSDSASRKKVNRHIEAKRIIYLITLYVKMLFKGYNIPFILTRIAATATYVRRLF